MIGWSWGDGDWLRNQTARHTYRPGWRLSIQADPHDSGRRWGSGWLLFIEFETPDTYQPTRLIQLGMRFVVPEHVLDAKDEDLFSKWLQHRLFDAEMHESREWLRRDGLIYDDPHAQERTGLVPPLKQTAA